ncbi:hypothetical protein SteCoe_13600 [Stentor coeruleus]|uniref:HSF-type DNA-binding domain-containing protein n=1 Tax=Stentor coeruleus TaxID=5963 RepID=A0A1R2C7Y6_9CILI|nr:hypothetical protein SteCoe_13600 [Stentor coeruleus]
MIKTPEEKSAKPNKFILRAYEMVNNPKFSDVISWTEAGYSFAISDIAQFTAKALPAYFKHKNFSSFVRQLNMYDFHKERDTGDAQIYAHSSFIRGHPEKLNEVHRKTTDSLTENVPSSDLEKKYLLMNSRQKSLQEKVISLERSYKDVSNYNQLLMTQLIQCMDREQKVEQLLMGFIQQVKEIPSSLESCYLNVMGSTISRSVNPPFAGDMSRFVQFSNQ